jgi:hypothetical protein
MADFPPWTKRKTPMPNQIAILRDATGRLGLFINGQTTGDYLDAFQKQKQK